MKRSNRWESLWAPLLQQAAICAARAATKRQDELSCALSSIVLSRTSWEAYINEFITWRGLPKPSKRSNFKSVILAVHENLGVEKPSFRSGGIWHQLEVLNYLRNAIIHHKAPEQNAVKNFESALEFLGVISGEAASEVWEKRVIRYEVAIWSCKICADAMLQLEAIKDLRTRSFSGVKRQVQSALKPLSVRVEYDRN